jgi:hypothetical protein
LFVALSCYLSFAWNITDLLNTFTVLIGLFVIKLSNHATTTHASLVPRRFVVLLSYFFRCALSLSLFFFPFPILPSSIKKDSGSSIFILDFHSQHTLAMARLQFSFVFLSLLVTIYANDYFVEKFEGNTRLLPCSINDLV